MVHICDTRACARACASPLGHHSSSHFMSTFYFITNKPRAAVWLEAGARHRGRDGRWRGQGTRRGDFGGPSGGRGYYEAAYGPDGVVLLLASSSIQKLFMILYT